MKDRVVTCDLDRHVLSPGVPSQLRYDEGDALVDASSRISIAADGEVHETLRGSVIFGPGGNGRARVVGDLPRIRRTAEIVLLLAYGL